MKCNQEQNGCSSKGRNDRLTSSGEISAVMTTNENETKRGEVRTKSVATSYDSYRTDSGYNSCSATSITSSSKYDDDEYDRTSSGKLTGNGSAVSVNTNADSGLCLDERFSRLSVASDAAVCTLLDSGLIDKLESYNNNYLPTSSQQQQQQREDWSTSELDVFVQRQKLIEEAFHPDKDGDTHLHLSIVHGRYDIINTLIQLAPETSYLDVQNNLFQCPLHLAVLMGLPKVVRRLLLAGASLDARNKLGNTPLHLACERGDVECVRELLRPASLLEVDYLRVRRRGWGPSQTPSYATGRSPVNLMASVPQDLEIRNYEGQMCVHLAAIGQHVQVLALLKQYGANMNSQEGKSGRSALWYAIESRNVQLVSFLVLECGASVNEPTYAGVTPFQLAYAQGTNLANGLLNLGACPTVPVLSDSDSDYSSIDDDESMDTDVIDGPNYFDLKINGEPLW